MQVLQFKTVHLAVIGAIASAFGMAAGNVNAEPLLTYESNKVVDGGTFRCHCWNARLFIPE